MIKKLSPLANLIPNSYQHALDMIGQFNPLSWTDFKDLGTSLLYLARTSWGTPSYALD